MQLEPLSTRYAFTSDAMLLEYAKAHREFAELAISDYARIYHSTWAERYERWAKEVARNLIDYSAITRDIAMSL